MSKPDRDHRILAIRIATLFLALAALVVAALGQAGKRYPGALLAYRTWADGKAGACSLMEALRSGAVSASQYFGAAQIRSRSKLIRTDAAGFELWKTPRGTYWLPPGNRDSLFYEAAEQQRKIYGTGSRGVRRGDIVLDCGARIGLFTRAALDQGAAQVIAIEPASENLECLRRNLATEIAERRVLVCDKGVWDRDGWLALKIDPSNTASDSFVSGSASGLSRQVEVTTIDSLVRVFGLGRVDFIKMDIEGAERQAISGALETIRSYRPRLGLAVYHLPDDARVIPGEVRKAASYSTSCNCVLFADGSIQAQVMNFY